MANPRLSKTIYYSQALSQIEKAHIEPFYLLFGEEHLLAENLINKIREKFLPKIDPEINYFVRYATETGIDEVLTLASGGSLFSDKKLIVLKEAQALKKEDVDRLSIFIEKKQEKFCLILLTAENSLPKTRLKNLQGKLPTVNLLPLRADDLSRFVREEFAKYGKRINEAAVEMLVFLVGTQLSDLMSQINNIAGFFTEKETIDDADIEQIASIYVTQNVFEFCSLLGSRKLERALFILHNLLDSGVSSQQVLAMMLRHFGLLWRIQGLRRTGTKSNDAIARELRIHSRFFKEYAQQSRMWKPAKLQQALSTLHEADRNLRDQNVSPKILLDILSYRLIN